MSEAGHGFIVVGHDKAPTAPFEVGDPVTTYELGEPLPFGDRPHSGHTQALLNYEEDVQKHANADEDWRVQEQLYCNCPSRRAVAQVLVHEPSSRLWVTAKPERVPAAFRRQGHGLVEGWAMHGAAGDSPHIGGVASCKGCDKRWLVISFADGAQLIRIKSATHGAYVAP